MPVIYKSIFDSSMIITKKDLCELLDLDTSRAGLKFSPAEIKKAYYKRAQRFHPDAQSRFNPPIPDDICNILMNDIVQARDYMLNGEDNIPGKAFFENGKAFFSPVGDWIDTSISILKEIKAGAETASSVIPWLSRFSNDFLMILLLSTYSNGQLNFRFVTAFSEQLKAMRPYLNDIDGSSLASFLQQLRDGLKRSESLDAVAIVAQLKDILPKSLTENKKFDDLIATLHDVSDELKTLLTDDFIDHLQHIVHFWPNFIATVPSWRHIIGVYCISLLFSATSLPKFVSAVQTITDAIGEHKGIVGLVYSALPLMVATGVLLPLNIIIQFGIQFAWITLKVALHLLFDGFKLLYSTVNTIRALFDEEMSLAQHSFTLFENVLNLSLRLSINLVIDIVDQVIFMLSNHSVLSSLQNGFNHLLDTMLDSLRPENQDAAVRDEAHLIHGQMQLMVIAEQEPAPKTEKISPFPGFFTQTGLPLHNEEDAWLRELLEKLELDCNSESEQRSAFGAS